MKSVVYPEPGLIEVVDLPDPELAHPADVILRVTAAGLCGSDVKSLSATKGDTTWPVGHEFVGVVEEVGTGVRDIKVGDRCFVPMFATCGHCDRCSAGEHEQCAQSAVFGSSTKAFRLPGGQAEFARIPWADHTLMVLPDEVSDDQGVMMSDILATAMTVLDKVGVRIGEDLLVVGCGPVGQLVVMCAPLFGVARVFVSDIDEERQRRAVEVGGLPWPGSEADGPPIRVGAAIDATGNPAALRVAFDALEPMGGRLGALNVNGAEPLPFGPGEMFAKRIQLVTVMGNPYAWRSALVNLTASSRIDPGVIVSDHVALSDAASAYDLFTSHRANKVILVP